LTVFIDKFLWARNALNLRCIVYPMNPTHSFTYYNE
jgi:hypothetical protein